MLLINKIFKNDLKTLNEFISAAAYIFGKQHFRGMKNFNFPEPQEERESI